MSEKETQLEGLPFSASFPLPFRVLFLGGLGILCWATNLHGLSQLGIDVTTVLGIGPHDSQHYPLPLLPAIGGQSSGSTLYRPVYRLFLLYAAWCLSGWILFRQLIHDNLARVDVYKFIPITYSLVVIMVVISPFRLAYKRERDTFLFAIHRCVFSSLTEPIYFSDVILADIITSFAKVLGDLWLSVCMFLPTGSLFVIPPQDSWSRQVVPCLMSLPYFIRFRQCVVEYLQPQNLSRRPLFNALKYASSFPVIFLSAVQRPKGNDATDAAWDVHPMYSLWLLAVAVNSLYSFWWDVTNDWGLELMKSKSKAQHTGTQSPPRVLILPTLHSRASSTHHEHAANGNLPTPKSTPRHGPWGLRPTLLYPLATYPIAIFFNLILRFTWSFKLSSHLHRHTDGAVIIFWIELAELLRRWVWVFFRVEWEVVRRMEETRDAESYELHDETRDGGLPESPTDLFNEAP